MSTALSIIIVSYNACGDLCDCLRSIYDTSLLDDYEVLVVDNNSTESNSAAVGLHFPKVRLFRNAENIGFPRANNQALREAKGEYVLCLNPDTVLRQDTLSRCVAFMRENHDVGLMGCKVIYEDGSIQYEGARNFPSLRAMAGEIFYMHMLFPRSRVFGRSLMGYWDHRDSRDVPCLLGAFMLGRRSLLDEMGGMDESVFMFLEDQDLCYRVREAGWRIAYLADAEVVHKSGRSQKAYSGSLTFTKADALYGFYRKHRGAAAAFTCWLMLLTQGAFRFTVGLMLWPVGKRSPRLRRVLRGACEVRRHYDLMRWAAHLVLGKRAATRSMEPITSAASSKT
jgi:GT2 family glycosyltransferase